MNIRSAGPEWGGCAVLLAWLVFVFYMALCTVYQTAEWVGL